MLQNSSSSPSSTPVGIDYAIHERRRHKRFNVERPGKIFRRGTQSFAPVRSRDLSYSGAQLEVESIRPLVVGEIVDVGLALSRDGAGVVASTSMLQAIVVRVTPGQDQRQRVAVRYIQPTAGATAA